MKKLLPCKDQGSQFGVPFKEKIAKHRHHLQPIQVHTVPDQLRVNILHPQIMSIHY